MVVTQVILQALVLLTVVGTQAGGTTCPKLRDPDDGGVRYLSTARGYRTFATYQCDEGYVIRGSTWQQCERDGQWTREPPTCEPASSLPAEVTETGPQCSKLGQLLISRSLYMGGPYWRKRRDGAVGRQPTTSGQGTESVPCGQSIIEEEDDRVVRGVEATRGSAPWLVQIATSASGNPFCGGSLISNLWVLTAAHCFDHVHDDEVHKLEIRLGKYQTFGLEEHQVNIRVAQVILHRRFDRRRWPPIEKSSYNHDIALIRLNRRVEYNDHIRPICFPTVETYESHFRSGSALVSGWGDTLPQLPGVDPKLQRHRLPKYLMKGEIELQNDATCDTRGYSRNMICAGLPSGRIDACQGDSGGPLLKKQGDAWYQIGLVSWGSGCANRGLYGYYTKVFNYYGWIQRRTGIRLSA